MDTNRHKFLSSDLRSVNSDFVCIGVHSWLCLLCFLCCLLLISPSLRAQSLSGNDLSGSISSNGWGKGGKHGHKPKPTPAPVSGGNRRPTGVDGETDWKNAGGTDWNTGTNWTGVTGTAPPAPGDVAYFTAAKSTDPNLSGSASIAGLYFKGSGSSGYNITSNSTAITLTLTGYATSIDTELGNDTAVAIGAENITGTNMISAPIVLAPPVGHTVSTIYQAGSGTLILSGQVSGSAALSKTGDGTLNLSGANTYSGGTTVEAGTLQISNSSGSATGSGAVTVNSSGTLSGTGIIDAGSNNITINGTLSPAGSSAGTITLKGGALTLTSTSTTLFNLGTNSDLIALGGSTALNLGGALSLSLGSGFDYGNTYALYSGISGTASGSYSSVTGYDTGSYTANLFQSGSEFDISFTPVPEPSTYFAGALALAVVGYTLRKRIGRVLARA
jgi:autotransporter-associated beta strand protein